MIYFVYMVTNIKQFIVTTQQKEKQHQKPYFFDYLKKHIAKNKKGVSKYLSRDVDKIVYGI